MSDGRGRTGWLMLRSAAARRRQRVWVSIVDRHSTRYFGE